MVFIDHSIIHIKPNTHDAIWLHTIYQSQCVHYKITRLYVTRNQCEERERRGEGERDTLVHARNTNFHRIEEGGRGGEHIAKGGEQPVESPPGTRVDAGHDPVL